VAQAARRRDSRRDSEPARIIHDLFRPSLMVFVVIDSETDHIPKTAARSLCTQSWLESCDAELRDIGVFYERQIQDACNKLIARFSTEA
jgi:hypothetical protein